MAVYNLEAVFTMVRGLLNDSLGEVFTDSNLQSYFNEPYRTLVSNLMSTSKRVQRVAYVNFPGNTTVLIPAGYGITDFSEPEVIEERQASAAIAITSTSAATPINALATAHGLG